MAILVISHFRKSAATMLLYRSLGSIAFTLATRVVLTLAVDPSEAGQRLLLPAKMNPLPEAEQRGRAFYVGLNKLTWDAEPVPIACDELRDLNAALPERRRTGGTDRPLAPEPADGTAEAGDGDHAAGPRSAHSGSCCTRRGGWRRCSWSGTGRTGGGTGSCRRCLCFRSGRLGDGV
ncbi:MAG: hypothetical protein U0992_00485 [Planctomycetaceae bacterium]